MSAAKESPRIRRLRSDFAGMEAMARESDVFCFEPCGSPPDFYKVVFSGPSTWLDPSDKKVKIETRHEVEIRLGAEYPRRRPDISWRTPLFHPNISAAGSVCLGGYSKSWAPSLSLASLCEMLWDMIRYANFDVSSPFNADAAAWAAKQDEFEFPLTCTPIRNLLAGGNTGPPRGKPLTGEGEDGIVFL